MFRKLFLLCSILFSLQTTVHGIQATTTHTVLYNRSKKDSNQYEANILIAWRAQNNSLHFVQNEKSEYISQIICMIRISTDTSIVKEQTFVINTPPQASPKEAFYQIIADQYQYPLHAGKYELEIVLYEAEHKKDLYQYSDTFSIRADTSKSAWLSGIQLLDRYFKNTGSTIYHRNGYLHIPLTSEYLDDSRDSVHYYYEVYNTSSIVKERAPIKVTTYISYKPFSAPVPGFEQMDTLQQVNFQYQHVSFPLKSLGSGNYYINTVLSDKLDAIIDKRYQFVQRYNANPTPSPKEQAPLVSAGNDSTLSAADSTPANHILDLTSTFVGKYSLGQVRAILKMLLLICEPNEGISINAFLKRPDELYSKYFIYNFWEKRDKLNPEKPWKEYAEKIKEVNRLFRGGGVPGYETDRGHIYIKYGKPNDRIIVNNESGALPYEIWQYFSIEKQGRDGVFLFYRTDKGIGDYTLLHSTVIGERRNSNWRALLYNNNMSGTGTSSSDSQAEQYIGNR